MSNYLRNLDAWKFWLPVSVTQSVANPVTDLSSLPLHFWQNVRSDGYDIRITDSNGIELPIIGQRIDVATKTGWVRHIQSTGAWRLYYGNEFATPAYPPQVPNMQLWLRADIGVFDASGNQAILNTAVATWTDLSGNGRHATQSTATARPLYKPTQWHGAVAFDNTDDGMVTGCSLPSGAYTVFLIANGFLSGHKRALSGAASNWLIGPRNQRAGHYAGNWVSHNADNSLGQPITNGKAELFTAINNGLTSQFRFNGIDRTNNSTPIGFPGVLHLGRGGFVMETFGGEIAEVLAYNTVLSSEQLNAIETYFIRKYSI